MKKVLVISQDYISTHMAGPAIRAWEFARVLSSHFATTLCYPDSSPGLSMNVGFETRGVKWGNELARLMKEYDYIVGQGYYLRHKECYKVDRTMIIDLYDPCFWGYYLNRTDKDIKRWIDDEMLSTKVRLERGSVYLCASERQRDMWLGLWMGMLKIKPEIIKRAATLDEVMMLVPYGLNPVDEKGVTRAIKGVYPGIPINSKVLLWGGGIWDWMNPQVFIQTVRELPEEYILFFMGTKHPNPDVGMTEQAKKAIAVAQELGLYQNRVIFNDWVSYEDRFNYYLDADVGLNFNVSPFEARYAFRTRMLDYINAGLPVLTNPGDYFEEIIAKEGIGEICNSPTGFAEAIMEITRYPERYQTNYQKIKASYSWDQVTAPLVKWINEH